ncbi:unnamed protein product, partial [Strongylus vulgaris]
KNGAAGAIIFSDPDDIARDGIDEGEEYIWCFSKSAINTTYRVGPGFHSDERLTMDVHSSLKIKKIRNVIGYIRGKDEPDRYVILGNHFDAWVYGSMDPNSGTAVLAEVARAMMQTVNETGWRPEFVEEFTDILQQRAVVYLNMDTIHSNMTLHVGTIPSLYRVTVEAAKRIVNPIKSERDKGRETVYDSWVKMRPSETPGLPHIPVPGGGSDHAAFLTYAAIGQFWAELARFFTDEAVLPFNTTELAEAILKIYIPDLGKALTPLKYYQTAIQPAVQQLSHMSKAAQDFLNMCRKFEKTMFFTRTAFSQNPFDARHIAAVNERLMKYNANYALCNRRYIRTNFCSAQRCFINPRGTATAPQSRHVLYSISEHDSYASRQMAAVYDAIDDFTNAESDKQRVIIGLEIANQISIVQHSIHCATNTLKDVI